MWLYVHGSWSEFVCCMICHQVSRIIDTDVGDPYDPDMEAVASNRPEANET
jgi:hypothetical protein